MLHHRKGEKLDDWLEKVRASHSFVSGVERDKAAVVAGTTLRVKTTAWWREK